MFESYGARLRSFQRWWRQTPPAFKLLTPITVLVLMLLPYEIAALLGNEFGEGKTKRSDRLPYPTDFGPDSDAPP